MRKRLTKDIISSELKKFNLELLSDFINSKNKILVKCSCGKVASYNSYDGKYLEP